MPDLSGMSGHARCAFQFLFGNPGVRRLLVNEWAETETGTIATSSWLAERRYSNNGWKKKGRVRSKAVDELLVASLVELDRYGNGCRLLRLSDAGKEMPQ